MPAASQLYEVIPRHTQFQIGRTVLPSQVNDPLVGIVKREGILERIGGNPALPAGNAPSRIVLHCCVRNLGTADFTLSVDQSANNNSDGLDPGNADVGPLTPDAYADIPIRNDGTAVAGGTLVMQPGGIAVFLIEWDETHDDYLRFTAPPTVVAAALAASGNIDMTGLPIDGETIILDDGVNPPVTYEFDGDASVTDTATLQGVLIGASATATIATLIALINTPTAGATLDITASAGAGDSADLVNDVAGVAGNAPIVEAATNTTATGMTGGANAALGPQPFGELTLSHYNGTLVPRAREGVI